MTAIPAAFMQGDDKTVENTTTETTLFTTGFGAGRTIPAASMNEGSMYRVTLRGELGAGAIVPSLHLRLYLGGVKLLDVTASGLVAGSGKRWSFTALLTSRENAQPGDVYGHGEFTYPGASGVVVDSDSALVEMQTQNALLIDVTAQWNIASANNTITCREALIESFST